MHNWKNRLTVCAGAAALAAGFAVPAYALPASAQVSTAASATIGGTLADAPTVHGRAAYLLDATTGKVRFSDQSSRRVPIASLTKIMTAYVVLKNAKPTDTVKVDSQDIRYAEDGGATTADLNPGDRVPVREIMYGLLLPSGADAAHALARAYGPGVQGFTAKMNATARSLGMKDTKYVNADGLPTSDGDGYSTARDQAVLAAKALQVPLIKRVTSTRTWHLGRTSDHGSYTWTNTNKLLGEPGVIGLKTGYTRAAGYNLAFAADQHGHRLIGVILGETMSSRRFSTAEALLNWASDSLSA
jgi:D-alanyl-D-alanine carboxypeptidase (penicillin-binding protein 5/6)